MVVTMKRIVFLHVMKRTSVEVYRSYGGLYRLHLQCVLFPFMAYPFIMKMQGPNRLIHRYLSRLAFRRCSVDILAEHWLS
jgi:hypothetical protein